jgi:hypothetical protein
MVLVLANRQPRIYTTSKQLIGGDDFNAVNALLTSSKALTAGVGGTLTVATQINSANVTLTVNNSGDSVILPPSYPGLRVQIEIPSGANSATVFPYQTNALNSNTADNIDGNTSVTQFQGGAIEYDCTTIGTWHRNVAVGAVNPSTEITQFGSGSATFLEEGNISRQTLAVGSGVSPVGTGADSVLAFFTIPANSFDIAGRGLQITAAGSFAANGNNKTVKLIASNTLPVVGNAPPGTGNAITIATTGVVTTNNQGWSISANLFKYGANGSNTQLAIHSQAQVGAAVSALQVPANATLIENAAMYLMSTGNAGTTATDIVQNWFEINAMN